MTLRLMAPPMQRRSTRVATWQLAEVLAEVLPELDREVSCEAEPATGKGHRGGLDLLAQRISTIGTSATSDSITRKLFAIKNGERYTIDAGFADELLMACGKSFTSASMIVLPGSKVAAAEMVAVHKEIRDDGAQFFKGMKTEKQLAESLMNFAIGFIFCDADIEEVQDEEAVAA